MTVEHGKKKMKRKNDVGWKIGEMRTWNAARLDLANRSIKEPFKKQDTHLSNSCFADASGLTHCPLNGLKTLHSWPG